MEPVNTSDRYCFDTIGTQWEIDTAAPLPAALRQQIAARIEAFDQTYSRFRADSLVTQIATAPAGGHFTFSVDSRPLFRRYGQLHALTGGAVAPLVGRQLEHLGYDSHYSLHPAPNWQTAGPDEASWSRDVVRHGLANGTYTATGEYGGQRLPHRFQRRFGPDSPANG